MLMVLNQEPRGMTLDVMRNRIAIMDKIDAGKVDIILKDEEHTLVCEALKNIPYGLAHRDLLATIDVILAADEPAAPMLPTEPKANGAALEEGPR
jgi:hypothetical protein